MPDRDSEAMDDIIDILLGKESYHLFWKLSKLERGVYFPISYIVENIKQSDQKGNIYMSWAELEGEKQYMEISLYDFSNFSFRHIRHNRNFLEELSGN